MSAAPAPSEATAIAAFEVAERRARAGGSADVAATTADDSTVDSGRRALDECAVDMLLRASSAARDVDAMLVGFRTWVEPCDVATDALDVCTAATDDISSGVGAFGVRCTLPGAARCGATK
jgi:hypothetical protein